MPTIDLPNSPGRRPGRAWLRRVGVVLAALTLGLAALLGALRLEPVARAVTRWALGAALPDGASARIGRVGGSLVGSIALDSLLIRDRRGDTVLYADSIRAVYDLTRLWSHVIAVHDLTVGGLRLTARRGADSSWSLFPSSPSASGQPSPWRVRIGGLVVTGRAALARAPDSLDRITDLQLAAHDLDLGAGGHGTVDRLTGRLALADHPDQAGSLTARLAWDSTRIRVDTVGLRTGASRVTARGTLPRQRAYRVTTATRFALRARPLSLDDLTPFFPWLAGGTLTARVDARGDVAGALVIAAAATTATGASLDVHGRVAPGASGPLIVALEATLSDLDPAFFAAGTSRLTGRIGATLETDLIGSDLRHLGGTARLRITPSRVGPVQIAAASLAAKGADGRFRVRLGADLDRFRLRGEGTLALADSEPGYRVRLEARGPELRGGVATVTASGRGRPDRGAVRLAARLDSLTLNGGPPVQVTAEGRLADRTLSLAVDAAAGSGSFRGRLLVHPFASTPSGRLTDGRLSDVDLAAVMPSAPPTVISGGLTGSFAGVRPGRLTADLRLALDSSRVGDERLTAGTLHAAVASGRLTLAGRLGLADGPLEIEAEARPFDRPMTYALHRASFESLDLGALLHRPAWHTSLTGRLAASGQGVDSATRRARGRLTLDRSTVRTATLDSGRVDWALVGDSVGATASADLGGGRVLAQGWARGSRRRTLVAEGSVDARGPSWRRIRVDSAHAALRIAAGRLRVDTLWLRSALGTASGGGTVPLIGGVPPADLRVTATLADVEPIRASFDTPPLSLGTAAGSLAVAGPADRLAVTGAIRLDALRAGDLRLVGLDADLDASVSAADGLEQARGTVTLQRLMLPRSSVASTRIEARYAPDQEIRVEASTQVDAHRTARVTARLDPAGQRPSWTVDRLDLVVDDDHWSLRAPARIQYQPNLAVRSLSLEAPGRRIAVNGVVDSAGVDDFHVAIDSFPVETVTDLLGYDRLAGTLTSRLDLRGTTSAPRATGSLTFDVRDQAGPIGRLHVTGSRQGDRIDLDGGVSQSDRSTLAIEGSAPWPGGGRGDLDLRFRAQDFSARAVGPFVDPDLARRIRGLLSGRVHLAGTLNQPAVDGHLDVAGGRVELPLLGVTWERVEASAQLAGRTVRIERANLESDDGSLNASGEVTLRRVTLADVDLDLEADHFRAIDNDTYDGVVSGKVHVSGTTAAPVLRGDVTVLRGDVHLDAGLGGADQVQDVTLTDADYHDLERYFGFSVRPAQGSLIPTLAALTLDLTVDVGRDTWLRENANPRLAVQLAGTMQVRKQPGPKLTLLGQLETLPEHSYVEQFGRRFDLRDGQVTFQGDRRDTRLDLEAAYQVPSRTDGSTEATIVLGLQGTVGDLQVVLSSEPSMSNEDIVSYLATGRPAGQALTMGGGGQGSVLSAGTGLALDRAASLVEGFASQKIGLDVIDIRRNGVQGTTLVAGRYVSPSLYLGFKQPLTRPTSESAGTNDQTQIEIELQAYRWLLLNFESGGDALQFFLRARHGY